MSAIMAQVTAATLVAKKTPSIKEDLCSAMGRTDLTAADEREQILRNAAMAENNDDCKRAEETLAVKWAALGGLTILERARQSDVGLETALNVLRPVKGC